MSMLYLDALGKHQFRSQSRGLSQPPQQKYHLFR